MSPDILRELSLLLRPAGGGLYLVSTGRAEQQALQRRFYAADTEADVTEGSGGIWERLHMKPQSYLDEATIASEGLDQAIRDFVAGMTDRFAVALYERLVIPRPWVGPMAWNQL